jgi:integrase
MPKQELLLESEKEFVNIDESRYKAEMFLRRTEKFIKNQDITKEQEIILHNFYKDLVGRQYKYRTIYYRIGQIGYFSRVVKKPYSQVTVQDLIDYFSNVKKMAGGRQKNGKIKTIITEKRLKGNSLAMRKTALIQFFDWLERDDLCRWLKRLKAKNQVKTENKTNKDVLKPNEILQMITACKDKRDKCLIAIIYALGLRIGEAESINIENIDEDNNRIRIRVDGKTGARVVPLDDWAVPYLKDWLNAHQFNNNKKASLFYTYHNAQYGRTLNRGAYGGIVKTAAKLAGINKHVYSHLLRHSRVTWCKIAGWDDELMRTFFGWSPTSNMIAVYAHFDMDRVEKKLWGIEDDSKDEMKEKLTPQKCSACGKSNASTNVYCDCGTLLSSEQRRKQADGVMEKLFEKPEFQELVQKLLKEN